MTRNLIGAVVLSVFAATSVVAQGSPQQQSAPAGAPSFDANRTPVTVEGCVTPEANVSGRKPNIAERAGIGEDYILTNAKVVKGSAPTARSMGQSQPGVSSNRSSAEAGQSAMFEIEGIDDDQLKQHVGKRVQIEGTFENTDRAGAAPERRTPNDDLVELRGTTIRQVAGACTAA